MQLIFAGVAAIAMLAFVDAARLGTAAAPFATSTSGYVPARLPVTSADLTPGWHTVDMVYAKGFFAVYYDGRLFTSYTSDNVTVDSRCAPVIESGMVYGPWPTRRPEMSS